jgi:hypothetical protein
MNQRIDANYDDIDATNYFDWMSNVIIHVFGTSTPPFRFVINRVCPGTVGTATDDKSDSFLEKAMHCSKSYGHKSTEEAVRFIVGTLAMHAGDTHGRRVRSKMRTYVLYPLLRHV